MNITSKSEYTICSYFMKCMQISNLSEWHLICNVALFHCTQCDVPLKRRPTWSCVIILINLLKLWSFELFDNQMLVWQVEALQGYRVIDIACGSGDAQTLCLTDDDTVWSWGDGDYGKLGRGGSDGCKVPMKVLHSYFSKMRKNVHPFSTL